MAGGLAFMAFTASAPTGVGRHARLVCTVTVSFTWTVSRSAVYPCVGQFRPDALFLHALTIITIDEGERWLGIVELILTSGSFTLNLLYARKRGQELGLKLRKLKAE